MQEITDNTPEIRVGDIRLLSSFPKELGNDVLAVLDIMSSGHPYTRPTIRDIGPVMINNEVLHIPSRIYTPKPFDLPIDSLNSRQFDIFACIYSRFHNGYVREKYIRHIIKLQEIWAVPYILKVIGEYVLEIIQVIENESEISPKIMQMFADENPDFIYLIQQRIISYWTVYYRSIRYQPNYQSFKDYPGFKAFDKFGLWKKNNIKYLLRK